jgi:RNA polymerase sigma-70 factor, ECF subfamily
MLRQSQTEWRSRTAGESTFEEYYAAEYSRLVRALLLLSSDASEAEELAQEAFLRVYERWDRVSTMDSPSGYLYRTALNLHRKRLRRVAVRARHLWQEDKRTDEIEIATDRLILLRAIAQLPRHQREALVLVDWLGLDSDTAGEVLGIASASVRGRLHRARATLRELIGEHDA